MSKITELTEKLETLKNSGINLQNTTLSEDLFLLKSLIKKYENTLIPIVLNKCYGGFQLSQEAYEYLGLEYDKYGSLFSDDRTNPKLIECVETLGKKASGSCSELVIEHIDIDELMTSNIDSNDGYEKIDNRDGYSILENYTK